MLFDHRCVPIGGRVISRTENVIEEQANALTRWTHLAQLQQQLIYIEAGIGDSSLTLICMRAQGVASGMFATAGVQIDWRTGQPKTYGPGRPILIDITSNTPETFHRGALAYAQVFEGVDIRVF